MIYNACDDVRLPHLEQVTHQDPIFGNKINANLAAYSNHCNFCDFWVGYTNEVPTAAISYLGGVYTVVALEGADMEQLAEFFSFMPRAKISGRKAVVEAVTAKIAGTMESSSIMMYTGGPQYLEEDTVFTVDNLTVIYDLLCEAYPNFKETTQADGWIYDVSLRVRRGLCYCCCIRYGGRPVATGMISSASRRSVVIGSLATLEPYRNRGYGKTIVTHLCNQALLHSKRPYLCCLNEELVPYYEKLLFKTVDNWAVFNPTVENETPVTLP